MQLEPLGSSLKVEPRGNGTSTIHSSAVILTLTSPKNQQMKGFLLPFPTPFLSAEPGGAGTPDVTKLVLLCFSGALRDWESILAPQACFPFLNCLVYLTKGLLLGMGLAALSSRLTMSSSRP